MADNKRTVAPTVDEKPILIGGTIKLRFERKGAGTMRPRQQPSSTGLRSKEKRDGLSDSKKSAAEKWSDEVLAVGLHALRKTFVDHLKGFSAEGPRTAFKDESNVDKNRYGDVDLLDKTRVKITINPDDDYIHGSFVEVCPQMRVICTQGPLENTARQFWIMIVEQSAKVILQLCQNTENGRKKCAEYVPLKTGGKMEFGGVKIKVVAANVTVGAMKKVTRTFVEITYGERIFETTHLLYAGWPDHTVPESLSTYLELRNLILRIYDKAPIVTHCSAGVGRTGSFVAIEMAIYALIIKNDREFSMVETIKKLRAQRAHSVQNDQQYAFIHRCVLEILASNGHIMRSSRLQKFCNEYEDLIQRKHAKI